MTLKEYKERYQIDRKIDWTEVIESYAAYFVDFAYATYAPIDLLKRQRIAFVFRLYKSGEITYDEMFVALKVLRSFDSFLPSITYDLMDTGYDPDENEDDFNHIELFWIDFLQVEIDTRLENAGIVTGYWR